MNNFRNKLIFAKQLIQLVLLAVVVINPELIAQNTNLYGYLKWFNHTNLNQPHFFDRLGTRLQLNFSGEMNNRLAMFAALDFNYEETEAEGNSTEPRSAGMDIYPVEMYLDFYSPHFDLRLGKQFIFWGQTDWINPTDNINPWDYKNISAEIEDYRIPVNALKANFYLGNWNLEAVGVFHFLPNKIPLSFPDSLGPFAARLQPARRPADKLANTELGFRLSSQIFQIDYSFSYFHGFDKSPSIMFQPVFNPFGAPQDMLITPEYKPYQVFGADFVTTRGQFALKGEGAYFRTEDTEGIKPFIENPHLKYVLGMDYYPRDDVHLNVQFVQKIRLKYDPNQEQRRLQELGVYNPRVADRREQSLSTMLKFEPLNFTSVQLIGVMNLKDRDFFLLPILNYQFADGLNIYGGATIFSGPEESPFGRSKPYSRAFVEVKYSFSR